MKEQFICIKKLPGFEPGDIIDERLLCQMMDILLEKINYEIGNQEHLIILDSLKSGLDILNDFVGLTIWPYDEDLLFTEFRELDSSFVTQAEHIQMLAEYRQKQIDSVLMDDFDSLFNKQS